MKSIKSYLDKILRGKAVLLILLGIAVIIILLIAVLLKHTHSFGEWELFKEPTCSIYGVERRSCACGELQERQIDKLSHIESDWIFDNEHNLKKKVCTVCGVLIKTESLGDHEHSWGAWIMEIEPTCTERGTTTRTCECGMSESMTLPENGHDFHTWTIIKEAACEVDGLMQRECKNCDHIEQKVINALIHKEGDWYIKDGYKLYPCVHCGTIMRSIEIEIATDLDIQNGVVVGIGDCKEADIEIPSRHNGVNVTKIGEKAFYSLKQITSVVIPESVKIIGAQAFWGCENIKAIVLPSTVEVIGERAFAYCLYLESISINTSIKKLDMRVFEYCYSLKSIYYDGTIAQWNAIEKDKQWDLEMSDYTIYCSDGTIVK